MPSHHPSIVKSRLPFVTEPSGLRLPAGPSTSLPLQTTAPYRRASAVLRHLVFGGLTSVMLLLTVGCQKSVTIELPPKGASKAPLTTFRVRFHADVDPATFQATLNGQTITHRFQPAAVPGGISIASSDFMETTVNYVQVLEVHALYKTSTPGLPTRATGDLVEFTPPTILVYRGNTTSSNLSVKERETIVATVFVSEVPRESLTVTLMTDDNSAVSLNEAPAGTPITVTIPNNDRRADFRIRGIEAGKTFVVRPLARGYASRLGGGKVSSP